MVGIWIAIAIALFTLITAYLGMHITIHPPETIRTKRIYKSGFAGCAISICVLVGIQACNGNKSQQTLLDKLKLIQQEILAESAPSKSQLPLKVAYPKTPKLKQPSRKKSVPRIKQFSEGPCSPNIVGNNNSTTCAPKPELTATAQLQRQLSNGEWLTSFTISSNVLIETGELKLLCTGPVLRAGISRINPAEFISGSNGPAPSNLDEVVYQLGPEMLSAGAPVVVGVYSDSPVDVISGSLGNHSITFPK